MPIGMYFNIPDSQILFLLVIPIFLLAASLLYFFKLKNRPGVFISFNSLLYLNWAAALWVSLVALTLARFLEYVVDQSLFPAWKAAILVLIVAVFGIFLHIVLTWFKFSIRALTLFAAIGIITLNVYPGYSTLGAEALREAGLGGGMRVAYRVKESPKDTPKYSPPACGCLVLATTSYVLIGGLDSCSSLARVLLTASKEPRRVREFARNEINIIKVFPEEVVFGLFDHQGIRILLWYWERDLMMHVNGPVRRVPLRFADRRGDFYILYLIGICGQDQILHNACSCGICQSRH
jgi:hypothetical protein